MACFIEENNHLIIQILIVFCFTIFRFQKKNSLDTRHKRKPLIKQIHTKSSKLQPEKQY